MKSLLIVAAALSALFLSTASVQACPPQLQRFSSSCQQGYSAPLAFSAPAYYAPQPVILDFRRPPERFVAKPVRAQQFRFEQLNDHHAPAQQIVILKEQRQPFRDAFRAFRGN